MNRGQLRAAVKSRLGIPTIGDAMLDDTTINGLIDIALRDIATEHDWPWLIATASLTFSSGTAPLPAAHAKTRELRINGQRAKFVPLSQFLDMQSTGYECVYTIIGANVQLSPVPSTSPTNTLYYIQNEPSLTTDTASPLIPDLYHNIVIARVSYHCNVRRNEKDAAARDDNEYRTQLSRMRDAAWPKAGGRSVRAAGVALWASW